jgi:serine/threonine protein kinase
MNVSDYPDFSSHGYQVTKELGRNREAGRITYLATAQNLDHQVVIKEFRFALADANWSGFKAYQREIEMLQQLAHPRIPRYLDSFETQVGFCLVQEYKNAPSLVERRSFNPEDIKQIALSVLEILVYLQRRTPPIIHRDIKPENILVDKQLNAYLVDFGFARIRGGELALSSVAAGTPGFMPPEEQFGRPLTEASDVYSLGATLICLLTGTRSVDIGNLIDDNYRFDFKKLVPKLNPSFIAWLDKMVAPNVKQRFNNAAAALDALKPMRVVGGANGVESLVGVVKDRRLQTLLGLTTLGIVTSWAVINSRVYQTEVPQTEIAPQLEMQVRQVKQFKKCLKCNLQGADLRGADLEDADLRGADLKDADLRSADLRSANLRGADLRSAKLSIGVNLSEVTMCDR